MQNKSDQFTIAEQNFADFCKALAHPARLVILKVLAETKGCICGDLVGKLPLSQSTVSQHLRTLKKAGLIQGEIDGPRVNYCLNKKNFRKFHTQMKAFFAEIENAWIKTDCC